MRSHVRDGPQVIVTNLRDNISTSILLILLILLLNLHQHPNCFHKTEEVNLKRTELNAPGKVREPDPTFTPLDMQEAMLQP